MVDADEGDVVKLAECPRNERTDLERCAHTGALREGDNIEVAESEAGLLDSLAEHPDDPLAVVTRGITREESLTRRGDICVPHVRKDSHKSAVLGRGVADDTGAELVRAALEAKAEQAPR